MTVVGAALVDFGGLRIEAPSGLLAPRPWTELQADWAVDLARSRPPGPVVELCAGVGHIGLAVARATGRRVILVDHDDRACRSARRNAARNGLAARVDVRRTDVGADLELVPRPALVLADPPYVPSSALRRFPDDPVGAIDGGTDGLAVARRILAAVAPMLGAGVPLLIQLGGAAQVSALEATLPPTGAGRPSALVREVRSAGPERAVALVTGP